LHSADVFTLRGAENVLSRLAFVAGITSSILTTERQSQFRNRLLAS